MTSTEYKGTVILPGWVDDLPEDVKQSAGIFKTPEGTVLGPPIIDQAIRLLGPSPSVPGWTSSPDERDKERLWNFIVGDPVTTTNLEQGKDYFAMKVSRRRKEYEEKIRRAELIREYERKRKEAQKIK